VVLGPARGWLFETLDERFTRDITAERMEFAWRLGAYLIIGAALVLINLLVDYAKIRAVVEDRRSMIGALIAGARFIARQPAGALGLYALNGLLFVLVLAVYALVSPGAGRDGLAVWGVLLVGQAYLLARLILRLLFAASQICFFQSRLAHANYAAFPVPTWPESPDAESLGRTGGR
jgi:hypothetical protein